MKILACLLFTCLLFVVPQSCTLAQSKEKVPTQEEIRQYFFKQVKDNADFYHHLNPKVTFTSYKQAAPAPYKFAVGTKTCYAVKLDMVQSNDFEGTTYVGTFTNDLYRFYHNEFGELELGNHVPGNLVSTTHPTK